MKKLYPLVLSTLFMATALVAPLAAQNNQNQPPQSPRQGKSMGGQRQHRGQGMKAKLQERFGLTDEQMQKIEDAKKTQQKVMMETKARENVLKAEMEYLWVAEKIDKNAIMAKFTEMEKLKRKAFTAGVEFKMTVANMLTADQRQEVIELLQNRRNKRQGGHQRFGRNNQMPQGQNFNRGFQNQRFNQRGRFNNGQYYGGYPQGGGYNNNRGGYGPQGGNFDGYGSQGGYGPQGGYGNQGGYGGYDDRGYDFDNVTDSDQ